MFIEVRLSNKERPSESMGEDNAIISDGCLAGTKDCEGVNATTR